MRFIILGGGCYGTFYVRQLLRARAASALTFNEVVIVDHGAESAAQRAFEPTAGLRFVQSEWDDFFDQYLESVTPASPDQFVPSPFNPHLGLAWLRRSLAASHPDCSFRLEPFSQLPGTPFQEQRDHGTLVASHADWICPVHCIEPEICPKTRDTRYWDMDRTARTLAVTLSKSSQRVDQVHLFHCHHISHGVGGYPVAELMLARRALAGALDTGQSVRALVGTISRCHGAFHLLVAQTGMDTVSGIDASSEAGPSHRAGIRR